MWAARLPSLQRAAVGSVQPEGWAAPAAFRVQFVVETGGSKSSHITRGATTVGTRAELSVALEMPPGAFAAHYWIKVCDWETQGGRVSEGGPRVACQVQIDGHGGYCMGATSASALGTALVIDAQHYHSRLKAPLSNASCEVRRDRVIRDEDGFIEEVDRCMPQEIDGSPPALFSPPPPPPPPCTASLMVTL